tara:strand:+ start:395 stop:703 length:309 start_codon:yes stop_codon:yes gene_type:complete
MSDKSIFGWIASSITLLYKLPQIYKIVKTKSSKDLSMRSIVLQSLGYIFYILHGHTIKDLPILVMGSVALCENTICIFLHLKYRNNKKDETEQKPITDKIEL